MERSAHVRVLLLAGGDLLRALFVEEGVKSHAKSTERGQPERPTSYSEHLSGRENPRMVMVHTDNSHPELFVRVLKGDRKISTAAASVFYPHLPIGTNKGGIPCIHS